MQKQIEIDVEQEAKEFSEEIINLLFSKGNERVENE